MYFSLIKWHHQTDCGTGPSVPAGGPILSFVSSYDYFKSAVYTTTFQSESISLFSLLKPCCCWWAQCLMMAPLISWFSIYLRIAKPASIVSVSSTSTFRKTHAVHLSWNYKLQTMNTTKCQASTLDQIIHPYSFDFFAIQLKQTFNILTVCKWYL